MLYIVLLEDVTDWLIVILFLYFQVFIGFPIFFLVICLFLMIMPLTNSPMECFMGMIMVATGIPVYIIGVMWKTKPRWFNNLQGIYIFYQITYLDFIHS